MSTVQDTEADLPVEPTRLFGEEDALSLHQLQLKKWMATAGRTRFAPETAAAGAEPMVELPSRWELTRGITPYSWQDACVALWVKRGGKGTIKVVTGGGKTLLALLIIQRVQNTLEPDLCVVIVVPTIVLLHQWYDAILEHGNLPREAIGRLGGGYSEDFGGRRRVLIAVLASARRQLPRLVKKAQVGKRLLLVADECHRTGARETSQVFKAERRWSLGLSATPEREGADAGYDQSVTGNALGPIIYEFNLADAVREGLVPKFTVNHFGLPMDPDERDRYEALSRSITDSMSKLRPHRDAQADGDFFTWARAVATRNKGDLASVAMRFIADTAKRRELLNHLRSRQEAVLDLLRREFEVNADARVILFHESITEVMGLYVRLCDRGFKVIAEHSALPGSVREAGLELFRKGTARVIVSARSLIEGFNVPAVDVGIIVASSGSVRQRLQSLGRVLRRHRGRGGEEKTSCIHVLYAAGSSEENIYGKVDWEETTGLDRNRYFLWTPGADPLPQDGPPKTPLPPEGRIDPATLVPGDRYPGRYEGVELSCDAQRNVRDLTGRFARDTRELAEAVLAVKGASGRFKVTPGRRFVLARVPAGPDWQTVYVTRLAAPLQFTDAKEDPKPAVSPVVWAKDAKTGDPYPFETLPVVEKDLRFKQKSGGVVSKKVRGGEVFARQGSRAEDAVKGADAARLVSAVKGLHGAGKKVSKIEVNDALHTFYREGGQLFFICALDRGLEFPPSHDTAQE